jgi:hypothetical protein
MLVGAVALLLACSPDPCSYGEDLPSCQSNRAASAATQVSINSAAAVVSRDAMATATQEHLNYSAKATAASINNDATRSAAIARATKEMGVIQSEATHQAIENNALATSYAMTITQQAAQQSAQATQQASENKIKTDQAAVQAAFAEPREWLIVISLTVGVGLIAWSFIRFTHRTAANVADGLDLKMHTVRYGLNNSQIAVALPKPKEQGGGWELIPAGLLTAQTLNRFSLPDQMKMLALVEADKRARTVDIAAAVGAWPALATESDAAEAARPPLPYGGYQIVASNSLPPLLAARPESLEVIDGEWSRFDD